MKKKSTQEPLRAKDPESNLGHYKDTGTEQTGGNPVAILANLHATSVMQIKIQGNI